MKGFLLQSWYIYPKHFKRHTVKYLLITYIITEFEAYNECVSKVTYPKQHSVEVDNF